MFKSMALVYRVEHLPKFPSESGIIIIIIIIIIIHEFHSDTSLKQNFRAAGIRIKRHKTEDRSRKKHRHNSNNLSSDSLAACTLHTALPRYSVLALPMSERYGLAATGFAARLPYVSHTGSVGLK